MAYFPMFINIEKQKCLVVGGGLVALRKVRVLLDFGAQVTVVAPEFLPELLSIETEGVKCRVRTFQEKDLEGCALVVAATDDAAANHEIAELAKGKRIPVNAVDQQEDCTFIFPSYIKRQNLVGAFSSSGNSPVITQHLKRVLADDLTEELGQINEYMGSIRKLVKARIDTESQRKEVYRQILGVLLTESENELSQERLEEIIYEARCRNE